MASQADLFNELPGSGSITDKEYARLLSVTGQPAGRFSLRDLYTKAGETPRLILRKFIPVSGGPATLGYGLDPYGTTPYGA